MAKVGEVFVQLIMKDKELQEGFENAQESAEKLEKQMKQSGRTIGGVIRDISGRFRQMGEGMIDGAENISQALGLPIAALGTLAIVAAKDTAKGAAAIKKLEKGFKQIQKAMVPLGQAILNMAVKYMPPFIKAIQNASKWFQELSPRAKELTLAIGGLAIGIGPALMFVGALVMILGTLGHGLAFLLGPVGLVVGALGVLTFNFYAARGGVNAFLADIQKIGGYINQAKKAIQGFGASILAELQKPLGSASATFKNLFYVLVQGIKTGDPTLIGLALSQMINAAVDTLPALLGTINWSGLTQGIIKGLNIAFASLATMSGNINWEAIAQLIANGLGNLAKFAGTIAPALTNGLIQIINAIDWNQIGVAFGNLVNTLAPIIVNLFNQLVNAIPLEQIIPNMISFAIDFALAFVDALFDPDTWIPVLEEHWLDLLLLFFTPTKLLKPLTNILKNIPIVGKISAWIMEQINEAGGPARAKIGEKIGGWFSNVKDKALDKLKDLGSSLWKKIDGSIGEAVRNQSKKFTDAAKDWKNKILSPFKNLNFKDLVQKAINKISSIKPPHIKLPHFSLNGWKQWGPVKVPNIGVKWYQSGGLFAGPSVIGVGESGPEAVVPLQGRRMKPFADAIASQIGGGGPNITVNNYTDDKKVGDSIARSIQREMWLHG